MIARKLGYIPDKPDDRDLHFAKLGLGSTAPATALRMQGLVTEILNQGDTSKCVAHAWAQALRVVDKLAGVPNPALSSRDFLYYNSLAYDGDGYVDRGTQLRSCAKGIVKFGRPPESACPFKTDPLVERPSREAYREAYDHKGAAGYYRVFGADEVKQAIAADKPVVGGTLVGKSIFGYSGGVYDPDPNEPKEGGHALVKIGYTPDYVLVVNSWGAEYGEGGFMRVSHRWAATFSDEWAVH